MQCPSRPPYTCEYDIPLYVGADLACCLSESVIDSIVEYSDFIDSVSDLEDKCLVFGNGREILDIIVGIEMY